MDDHSKTEGGKIAQKAPNLPHRTSAMLTLSLSLEREMRRPRGVKPQARTPARADDAPAASSGQSGTGPCGAAATAWLHYPAPTGRRPARALLPEEADEHRQASTGPAAALGSGKTAPMTGLWRAKRSTPTWRSRRSTRRSLGVGAARAVAAVVGHSRNGVRYGAPRPLRTETIVHNGRMFLARRALREQQGFVSGAATSCASTQPPEPSRSRRAKRRGDATTVATPPAPRPLPATMRPGRTPHIPC